MAFVLSCCIHYLFFLWLHPPSTSAKSNANISLGSYLTALDDNSSCGSPSGFLLAIWLEKIPEKTIIWSANGNSLVQRGSKVELTIGGQLVLYDSNIQQVWAADVAASGVNYASMLNTGNFVLARQDYVSLWEKSDAKSRQEDPLLRPSMKNVLQMLGGATEWLNTQ
ncbi:g-type lectin s-receptor-like serine/threonine-protein kinase lecrk1 [Quercus suber]|uniref:G-type lectin s-receptor-like serine/threonine-protein kinase lecrk1 n=1 Tax=Quercus suber TaxID=58331 RepID=A0AAW0JHF7_QUESU